MTYSDQQYKRARGESKEQVPIKANPRKFFDPRAKSCKKGQPPTNHRVKEK